MGFTQLYGVLPAKLSLSTMWTICLHLTLGIRPYAQRHESLTRAGGGTSSRWATQDRSLTKAQEDRSKSLFYRDLRAGTVFLANGLFAVGTGAVRRGLI